MHWIILIISILTLCLVAGLYGRSEKEDIFTGSVLNDPNEHDLLADEPKVQHMNFTTGLPTKRGQSAKTQKRASNGRFA